MSQRISLLRVKGALEKFPLAFEHQSHNILIGGFSLLLVLICLIGYMSERRIEGLEEHTAALLEAEPHRFKVVEDVHETFDEITYEARLAVGMGDRPLLSFPTHQSLNRLNSKMGVKIDAGRKSSLGLTPEWNEFETAYAAFWPAISDNSAGDIDWGEKRDRVGRAIQSLFDLIDSGQNQNDAERQRLSAVARHQIFWITGGAVFLGLVVAGLAFMEIYRGFRGLENAYQESDRSRDYLESLLNSLLSAVVVVEKDGTIATVNKSFLNLDGPELLEPIGKKYTEVFAEYEPLVQGIEVRLADEAGENEHSRYCCRVEMSAGRLHDVFASPLLLAGDRLGTILIFVDVTEAERTQRELLRNRALSAVGQMTAQIAHEIKNPLGSIGFALELLKRKVSGGTPDASPNAGDGENGEFTELIDVMGRSVDYLAATVTELLEFTRPKDLKLDAVNLNDLMDGVIPMTTDRLNEKSIELIKDYQADLPTGQFDAGELKKLFLNLLINAIDASESGGKIEVGTSMNGSGLISVDIADHGSGMDPETKRRLFEPFYTTKTKGTGLGMSIAKKIAELHHGDLYVRSQKGSGTVISVRLPADPGQRADNPAASATV